MHWLPQSRALTSQRQEPQLLDEPGQARNILIAPLGIDDCWPQYRPTNAELFAHRHQVLLCGRKALQQFALLRYLRVDFREDARRRKHNDPRQRRREDIWKCGGQQAGVDRAVERLEWRDPERIRFRKIAVAPVNGCRRVMRRSPQRKRSLSIPHKPLNDVAADNPRSAYDERLVHVISNDLRKIGSS